MADQNVVTAGEASLAEKVEEIWRDVLGVPDGQTDGAFLDLGGQSIAAVLIATRIEEELGVSVEVADLFDDPDLDTFVRMVAAKAQDAAAG